jgi:hypothetical protein
MADGKKSVLLYCDILHTIEQLDDATAGQLFKHYLRYINDLDPETENVLVKIAFEPIKQNLKRDLKKWEKAQEEKSLNGRMGNLKRYHLDLYELVNSDNMTIEEAENIAKSRKASPCDNSDRIPSQDVANVAVTDNVTVNVTDIDSNTILSVKPDVKVSKKVVYNTDVDSVYFAYPSQCPIRNSSNGKTSKNKEKIRSLLKNTMADHLINVIKRYEAECRATKTYMKNFATFLNNLPDYSEVPEEKPKEKKSYLTYEDLK